MNPLVVEDQFQALLAFLGAPSHWLHRLQEFLSFLRLLEADPRHYESYLLECGDRLDRILADIDPGGVDPGELQRHLEHIEQFSLRVSKTGERGVFDDGLDKLRQALAGALAYVGDVPRAVSVLEQKAYQETPADGHSEQVHTRMWHSSSHPAFHIMEAYSPGVVHC